VACNELTYFSLSQQVDRRRYAREVRFVSCVGRRCAGDRDGSAGQCRPTDSIFVSVLDEQGIPYTQASDAILVAKGVCVSLNEGNSLTDATLQVKNESGLSVEQSGFLVGAAAAAYCPSQSP